MAVPYNTSTMRIYWDSSGGSSFVILDKTIDCSVTLAKEMKDSSTKDDGASKNVAPSFTWASGSASGLQALGETGKDVADSLIAGDKVAIRYSTEVSSDEYIEFDAYITSVELSSPGMENDCAWSISFESTGAITTGTVA